MHLVPVVRQAGRADSRQLVGNEQPVCSYLLETSRGVSLTCYARTLDASRSIAMTSYYSLTFEAFRGALAYPNGWIYSVRSTMIRRRSSDFVRSCSSLCRTRPSITVVQCVEIVKNRKRIKLCSSVLAMRRVAPTPGFFHCRSMLAPWISPLK